MSEYINNIDELLDEQIRINKFLTKKVAYLAAFAQLTVAYLKSPEISKVKSLEQLEKLSNMLVDKND